MNMKRQISISVFLSILVILLAFLYIRFFNDTKPENNGNNEQLVEELTEAPSLVSGQEYTNYLYYIKDEDGRLVVFQTKTQEYYMDTGIEKDVLPEDLQEKLETGLFFATEKELYDFLESYSS